MCQFILGFESPGTRKNMAGAERPVSQVSFPAAPWHCHAYMRLLHASSVRACKIPGQPLVYFWGILGSPTKVLGMSCESTSMTTKKDHKINLHGENSGHCSMLARIVWSWGQFPEPASVRWERHWKTTASRMEEPTRAFMVINFDQFRWYKNVNLQVLGEAHHSFFFCRI